MLNSITAHTNSELFKKLAERPSLSPFFNGPLRYEQPVFSPAAERSHKELAEAQALMDWNRSMSHYFIGERSVQTIRGGKKFRDIADLKAFITQHLLCGMEETDHRTMLDQGISHLHQGGLLHSAGIAISRLTLRGMTAPSPTFDYKITLYPLETGIGLKEELNLSLISLPDTTEVDPKKDEELNFNVKHYAALTRDPGYANVSANTLHSHITVSDKALEILELDKSQMPPQKPQPFKPKAHDGYSTIWNFLTWPADVLGQTLGWLPDISSDLLHVEKQWLRLFEHSLETHQHAIASSKASYQSEAALASEYMAENSDSIEPLDLLGKEQVALTAQAQDVSSIITKFENLNSVASRITHSEAMKAENIQALEQYQSQLIVAKGQLNKLLKALYDHPSDLRNTFTQQMQEIEGKLAHVQWVIDCLKEPTALQSLFVSPLKNSIEEGTKDIDAQKNALSTIQTRLEAAIEKQDAELRNVERVLAEQEKISSFLMERTEKHQELAKLLKELSGHFSRLSISDDYTAYLRAREEVMQKFQEYEAFAHTLDKTERSPDSFKDRLSAQKQVRLELKEDLETAQIQLNESAEALNTQYAYFEQQTKNYRDPTFLIEPSLTIIRTDLEVETRKVENIVFQKTKRDVLHSLAGYIGNSDSWGHWGTKNGERAKDFKLTLLATANLSELYSALQDEYHKSATEVANPLGGYRTALNLALEKVTKYIHNEPRIERHDKAAEPPSAVVAF